MAENTGAGTLGDEHLERGDGGETGTEVVPLSHGSGEGLWDTAGMRMSMSCLNVLQDISDAVSLYSGDDRTLGRTKKETKQKKTKTFADFFKIKRRNKSQKSAADSAIDGKNEQTKVNLAADGKNNDKENGRKKYREEKAIAGNFSVEDADDSRKKSSTFTPNELSISQQKQGTTHSMEEKANRTKKSSKEKRKEALTTADEREESQSLTMTQPLKQLETRILKKVKQKSPNTKDLAAERSKAEDILEISSNGKADDILLSNTSGKTQDILETKSNGKSESILMTNSSGKTEDILEIPLKYKAEDIIEIPSNGNAEDILEIASNGKADDILETKLNGKAEVIMLTKSIGKTEDITENPSNDKAENILEIPSKYKADDILMTNSRGKKEDILETKSNGKAQDILEIPSTGETMDILEIPSNEKAENILEIPSIYKVEDILENKSNGKAEDILEIPTNGKREGILEMPPNGKTEDILEMPPNAKTEDILEIPPNGKTEDILEIPPNGKTEDILETPPNGKTEDILETKLNGKAEDILDIPLTSQTEAIIEIPSEYKAEDILEMPPNGKTEDILETKSTDKTGKVLRTPFTGKIEYSLDRSNGCKSSDGKEDRGEGSSDGSRGRSLLTRVEDIRGANDRRLTTNSKQTEDASIYSQEISNTIPRGRPRNRNEDEKLRRGRSEDPVATKEQSAKRRGKRRRRALSREWVMVRTTTTEYTTTTTVNRNAKTDDGQRLSPSNAPNKKDGETGKLLEAKINQVDDKALQREAQGQLPNKVNDSKDFSEILNKDENKSISPLLSKTRIERNQDNAMGNLSSAPPPVPPSAPPSPPPLQNSLADSNSLSMAQSESLQNSDTLQPIDTVASSAKELTGGQHPFQSDSFGSDDHNQAKETSFENLSDTTKAFTADSFSKPTESKLTIDSGVTSTEINFHGTAFDKNPSEPKSGLVENEKRNRMKPQIPPSDNSDIDLTITNHQMPNDRKTGRLRHPNETEISRTVKAKKINRTRETLTPKHPSYSSSSSSSSSSFVNEVKSKDRSADDASYSGLLRLDGGGGGGWTTDRPRDCLGETKSWFSAASRDVGVFSPEPESEEEDGIAVSSHSNAQLSYSAVEAEAVERCPETNETDVDERELTSRGEDNQEKQNEGQSEEKINAFIINDVSTDSFAVRQTNVISDNLRDENSAESDVFSQNSCPKTSSDSLPCNILSASLRNENSVDSSKETISCEVIAQGGEQSTGSSVCQATSPSDSSHRLLVTANETMTMMNHSFDSENTVLEKKHSMDSNRGSRETSLSTGKTSAEDGMSGLVDEGYGSVKRKNCGKQRAGDRAVKKEDKRRKEKANSRIISSLTAMSDRIDSENRSTENETSSLSSNSATPNTFSKSIKIHENISQEDRKFVTSFVKENSESLSSTSEGVKESRESGYEATAVSCLWMGHSVARNADKYACKAKERPEENSHFTPGSLPVHSSSCLHFEGSPLHQTEQHQTVRGGAKYQQRMLEGTEVSTSGQTEQHSQDNGQLRRRRRRGSPGCIEDEGDETTTAADDRTNPQDSSSSSSVHRQIIIGKSVLNYFFISIAGLLSLVCLIYVVYIL